MSLFSRIHFRITLVILLCFLPAAGILGYLYFSLHDTLHQEHIRSAQSLADNTVAIHQQWINEAERSTRILVLSPTLTESRYEEASQLFKELALDNPNIHNIIMVDQEGTLVASGRPWPGKLSYADRKWFEKIMKGEEYSFSKVIIGKLNQQPLVSIAMPVRNQAGEKIGVLSLGYKINQLNEDIDHLDFDPDDHYVLMNLNGDIYHSFPDVKRDPQRIPNYQALLARIQSGQPGVFEIPDQDHVYAVTTLNHSGDTLYCIVGVHEESHSLASFTPWYVILLIMLLSGLIIFTLALINAWFSVIHPAKMLASATQNTKNKIGTPDLEMPRACLELQQVADAFNDMHHTLDDQHNVMQSKQQELEEANQKLNESIRIDMLTGAYSRRHGIHLIEQEIERFTRYQTPFSILLMDVDHFKQINDTHGHQVGDHALVKVVHHLRGRLRVNDHIIRYAGDEFIVVLANAGLTEASAVSESLIESKIDISTENLELYVSLSIGISHVQSDLTCQKLIDQADQAMYEAKKYGRNAYHVFTS